MTAGRGRRVGLCVVAVLLGTAFAGCTVTQDNVATFKWAAYGNNNSSTSDWTGGDGGASTRLPDGRYVYIYNDMFAGSVSGGNPASRSTGLISARNALVVADSSNTPVSTLTGPGGGDLVPPLPGTTDRFQWGGGRGIIENNQLKLIANRIGPNGYADHFGTYIASFSLPGLNLVSVQQASPPAPSQTHIFWSDLFPSGAYTYIYGDRYIARAPAGNLAGPWQYRTASGWSSNEGDAVKVQHFAGTGSVIEYQGTFYAFGMELTPEMEQNPSLGIFSQNIRGCAASTPYGPWPAGQCANIYHTPEAGQEVAQNTILIVYAVSPHFDDINGDGMLLSYSVNALCYVDCPSPSANQQNVAHYRPRWVRVLPD
jgi:hypothetical protein